MMNIFSPVLDFMSQAFMPFTQGLGGPGLGSIADAQNYNAKSNINPFSIGSIAKLGPYVEGLPNALGSRYTGGMSVAPNYGPTPAANPGMSVAPNYQNQMKQMYTQMMINKLGQPRG